MIVFHLRTTFSCSTVVFLDFVSLHPSYLEVPTSSYVLLRANGYVIYINALGTPPCPQVMSNTSLRYYFHFDRKLTSSTILRPHPHRQDHFPCTEDVEQSGFSQSYFIPFSHRHLRQCRVSPLDRSKNQLKTVGNTSAGEVECYVGYYILMLVNFWGCLVCLARLSSLSPILVRSTSF